MVNIETINVGQTTSMVQKLYHYFLRSSTDIFLISEFKQPQPTATYEDLSQQWEALSEGYAYYPFSKAAILLKKHPNISNISPIYPLPTDITNYVAAVRVTLYGKQTIIISIYSRPQSSTENDELFTRVSHWLETTRVAQEQIIIGGDWNCVLDPYFDQMTDLTIRGANKVENCQAFINTFGLVDTHTQLHPDSMIFTNEAIVATGTIRRRLDRIYISPELIPLLQKAGKGPDKIISTHYPYCIELAPYSTEVGTGYWRLALDTIADPDFRESFLEIFTQAQVGLEGLSGEQRYWKFNEYSRRHLRRLAIKRAQLIASDDIKAKARRQGGAILHSRLPGGLQPHVANSVFLHESITKQNSLIRGIYSGPDKQVLTKSTDILNTFRKHTRNLYKKNFFRQRSLRLLLAQIPQSQKVSKEDAEKLEHALTEEEISTAMKLVGKRKAPGPDGLPIELYLAFPDVFVPLLCSFANDAFDKGNFDSHFTETYIHYIPKDGDRKDFNNWRPLSLMNTDIKIINMALKVRLERYITSMVHGDQTGFIPNRNMSSNINDLQVLIEDEDSEGFLWSLDFSKAYDRPNREALRRILLGFGLGPHFVRMIMSSLRLTHSRVVINNMVSRRFRTHSGVRQGDPLSPLLYALILEPFLSSIRQDRKIKGFDATPPYMAESVRVPGPFDMVLGPDGLPDDALASRIRNERKQWADLSAPYRLFKVRAFADDVIVAVKDQISCDYIHYHLAVYLNATRSVLNNSKSKVLKLRRHPRTIPYQFKKCVTVDLTKASFRYLGVRLGGQQWSTQSTVWETLLTQLRTRLSRLYLKDLTLTESVILINCYVFSIITFQDQYINATDLTISIMESMVVASLKKGRRKGIVNETKLFSPIERGGFGLHKLSLKLVGLRAKRFTFFHENPSFARTMIYGRAQESLDTTPWADRHSWDELMRSMFSTAPRRNQRNPRYQEAFYHPKVYAYPDLVPHSELPGGILPPWLSKARDHLYKLTKRPRGLKRKDLHIGSTLTEMFLPHEELDLSENIDLATGAKSTEYTFKNTYKSLSSRDPSTLIRLNKAFIDPNELSDTLLLQFWKDFPKGHRQEPEAFHSWHLFWLGNLFLYGRWSMESLERSEFMVFKSPLCAFCHQAPETLGHVFFECEWTRFFWSETLGISQNREFSYDRTFYLTPFTSSPGNKLELHISYAIFIHCVYDALKFRRFHVLGEQMTMRLVVDFIDLWNRGVRMKLRDAVKFGVVNLIASDEEPHSSSMEHRSTPEN